MDLSSRAAVETFLEMQASAPQQGPGSDDSTRRAFGAVGPLPPKARILDMGCGTGRQSLALSRLAPGARVEAIDHVPHFVEVLERRTAEAGLGDRVRVRRGSMLDESLARDPADLVWSEGAVYAVGLREGLSVWRGFLRSGGTIAFTEVCWLTDSPSQVAREFWEAGYPAICSLADNLSKLEELGFECIDHFVLPDSDWWDYLGPLEERCQGLRAKYAGDPERLAALDGVIEEVEMYRAHGDEYGYAFFIVRPRC